MSPMGRMAEPIFPAGMTAARPAVEISAEDPPGDDMETKRVHEAGYDADHTGRYGKNQHV